MLLTSSPPKEQHTKMKNKPTSINEMTKLWWPKAPPKLQSHPKTNKFNQMSESGKQPPKTYVPYTNA